MSEVKLTREQWENGRKWVAELRKTKKKQVHGALREGRDGRCCLGVLCDVYIRETREGAWVKDTDNTWRYMAHGAMLPGEVAEWIGNPTDGVRLPEAVMKGDTPMTAAYHLNDTGELTFPEIADVLEAQLYPATYPGDSTTPDGGSSNA